MTEQTSSLAQDITGRDRTLLEAFYRASLSEGGTADEVTLRGIHAVLEMVNRQPLAQEEGEVAELVRWLREGAQDERDAENGGTIEAAVILDRIATLLSHTHFSPVPVADRPWERSGWCDEQGRCWWGRGEIEYGRADWTLATAEEIMEFCEFSMPTLCLPANAMVIPL